MRGEIWTMRDDLYASKARPVSCDMLGKRIGVLEDAYMDAVSCSLRIVLGL